MPGAASASAEELFRSLKSLNAVRSPELREMRDNYEGDHEKLVEEYLLKPPAWDEPTWAYVKRTLMAINTTRTSMRSLSAGVYGGVQTRQVTSTVGPFTDQLNQLLASPAWLQSMKRILREVALYGTAYMVPTYDQATRRFRLRHLNPVTTHIITDELDPEVPVAVAEFDERKNWIRVWTRQFSATLARSQDNTVYSDYVDGDDNTIELPFFPVHISKSEDVPGSPYGIPMLRDTPKFNRALAVAYFNVNFTSLLKAQAMLAINSADEEGEVNADMTQLGAHTALILPKGATAEFLASNADVSSLLDVMDKLQALESYVLGIPNIQAQKNLSAEGARLAATPLTSQISDLALNMTGIETSAILLIGAEAHWAVGSPIKTSAEDLYKVSVRINPSVNTESLSERVNSKIVLMDKGVVPEEDVVAEFNGTMTYPEIVAQAETVRDRRSEAEAPKRELPTAEGEPEAIG